MSSLFVLISTATLVLISLFLFKRQRMIRPVLVACVISLFLSSQSVAALPLPQLAAMGASDSALDQRQRVLDEGLKIDPTKLRYRGLEYVQFQPNSQRLSDPEIKSLIKSDINHDVFVAVASGSVQVFGNVQDIDIARDIVTQVKEIPGVREVMFDIGLETKAE